jgi:hypothetical protein
MNPVRHVNDTKAMGTQSQATRTASSGKAVTEDLTRVMAEIEIRATQLGPVLEGILREPHGSIRWGLNE